MKEKIKNCNEEKYIINKEDIIKVENIIKEECELFDVLEKNEIEIKFVVNENKATIKYERESGEFFVYLLNKSFERCKEEIILKQFGLVLNDFLIKNYKEFLKKFMEIYEELLGESEVNKDINCKSNEFADVFSEAFVHYIIEKADRKKYSKEQLKELEQMNLKEEKYVREILEYFDNMFKILAK